MLTQASLTLSPLESIRKHLLDDNFELFLIIIKTMISFQSLISMIGVFSRTLANHR
ncbi:hypothetical protein HanXRQr2_Chr16g0765811 [Helianthus annuus]|uniref:Uncharacterized protein n=1 Tax=Helianthus annuus TaxID=4232 RepID=A0A9K3H045_HELAN|nr:hypothetical protein HanXRQr2_Chr16g0765811 [Helianthus annuus]KAJ0822602.1 hypothetical protein HanPSC8_Chr16g0733981 [Helianthus annuus]